MNATMLANGGKKEKRRELDFYPTPPEVTHALMRYFTWGAMVIHEPACGDGSMSKVLQMYGHTVYSTDLRETGFGTGGLDFLVSTQEADAIITNPPFCLSEQFIVHALKLAPIVAMVLKSQYWHSRKRAYLFEQHPPSHVLALTWRPDFMGGEPGGSPTMEVHWTVWIEGQSDTRYRLLRKETLL
jgi:hypothetical protein